ncbi:shikimate dehydrogenase [Microvirga roseola]|uniref:shikimate dehydrogenase n=1 Tax=Microvirga roseola TaxID=2883126 RepID=UPI001E35C4D5|nr:shikimate dehydrogenase [Microvirga roseola]
MTKAFVVGHPIKHSRSPLIHGYWLQVHDLDGSYERIDVEPVNFGDFLRSFGERGYTGGNVTIPHKEAAFAGVDRRTERAERLGAVNTLWIQDGLLWGDNTDVLGFIVHLDQSLGTGWEQSVDNVMVLGAGGAARAVVAGLQDRPLGRILVANRTLSKAESLVHDLEGGAVRLEAMDWDRIGEALAGCQLVVNTTSLGMAGQPPLSIDLHTMPDDAAVADIVYVPLKTPLLAAAEARGLRTVDGLGMLLHQAAPGFERWFGVRPQVTPELRALIVADIEGRI